jgi:hypothetical protein
MKNTIIGIIIITAVFLVMLISINNDKKRNTYWEKQYEICGYRGWYFDQELRSCMPVDTLNSHETD